ncbi:MAG: ATP-binding protein [Thermoguttaceae bacterium]
MKLPPEGARWLIAVRWLACVSVVVVIWTTSSLMGVLHNPAPLYLVAATLAGYNLLFVLGQRFLPGDNESAERSIFWQISLDLVALTLLLYFSNMSRNPFLVYFVFHMIIAGMYLRGMAPYFFAGMSSVLVGAVLLLEHLQWIPVFPLHFPSDPPEGVRLDGLNLLGVFVAVASALWITVYFTISIRRYVDRAHAEIRQKEKMLGIGQLVAGIAHQIANPLDGVQNCLRLIGEKVKDDARLTDYVQMMAEALQRIERTAKRVQAFARPHGITLRSTDVNGAVEATLQMLAANHNPNIRVETDLGEIPPVQGDLYTLQEVLFNLCTNALIAMPDGGTLTLHTYSLGRFDEDQMGSVAIEVIDTGIGIPQSHIEKVFEPFYTTRGESGGTGLGLGLCRMLIAEMGGRIEVRSVLRRGTTFTVMLNPADPTAEKTNSE